MTDLMPKCPVCGTRLWERTGDPKDHLWVCGAFPDCSFEVLDSTIQEARRRYLRKQFNTAAVSGRPVTRPTTAH